MEITTFSFKNVKEFHMDCLIFKKGKNSLKSHKTVYR